LRRRRKRLKKIEVRISGLGGQGVVLAGQTLGRAAVYNGNNVVQTQSYGAEARGSTAKSEVIISDARIGFPVIRKCDILVAMSQEAVEKNIKDLKEDGILVIDSSTVKNAPKIRAKILEIPATQIAEKTFREKIYANMVMLGVLTRLIGILDESMEKAIMDTVPEKVLSANLQAYKKGKELIGKNTSS
jgi:2-oxoglutarate ferredoxin oxidoreductase subunit gamma